MVEVPERGGLYRHYKRRAAQGLLALAHRVITSSWARDLTDDAIEPERDEPTAFRGHHFAHLSDSAVHTACSS